MKSIVLILAILFVLNCAGCVFSDSNMLVVDESHSMLQDFYVESDVVHIICRITVINRSDECISTTITGFSDEDVANGLLINPELTGINLENGTNTFSISAGETVEFLVDFQGVFFGNPQKYDRLIPDNISFSIIP